MNHDDPRWYKRLASNPLGQERKPTAEQLHTIQVEVMKVRKPHSLKWSAAAGLLALSLFIVVWILSMNMDSRTTTAPDSIYAGIEVEKLAAESGYTDADTLHAYQGHTDKWAVTYLVNEESEMNLLSKRLVIKYIGKEPYPAGQLSISYDAGGGDLATAGATFSEAPADGIYLMLVGSNHPLNVADTVKLQIMWNKDGYSDYLELKLE